MTPPLGRRLHVNDDTAALAAALRTEHAERERLRAAYEALGVGSIDPAFARAVAAFAAADVRCANLEAESERRRNLAGDGRARSGRAS